MAVNTQRPPVNVLVVEDGEDQRFLMQRYFEMAGCRVTTTESAEGAMESCAASPPDVAMIDLILPGMNGWDLAERIRSGWPQCVVVIASVLNVEQYPASDARFTKPVTRANVQEVLENFVPGWAA
ncbi:MAG: response regulator [Microbacteriaceae bacterium]|nr:response regulator [Microbacteriaceae bacterium]